MKRQCISNPAASRPGLLNKHPGLCYLVSVEISGPCQVLGLCFPTAERRCGGPGGRDRPSRLCAGLTDRQSRRPGQSSLPLPSSRGSKCVGGKLATRGADSCCCRAGDDGGPGSPGAFREVLTRAECREWLGEAGWSRASQHSPACRPLELGRLSAL